MCEEGGKSQSTILIIRLSRDNKNPVTHSIRSKCRRWIGDSFEQRMPAIGQRLKFYVCVCEFNEQGREQISRLGSLEDTRNIYEMLPAGV